MILINPFVGLLILSVLTLVTPVAARASVYLLMTVQAIKGLAAVGNISRISRTPNFDKSYKPHRGFDYGNFSTVVFI